MVAKYNSDTGSWSDTPIDDTDDSKKDKGDVAFTFRKFLDETGDAKPNAVCEADIESNKLKALLKVCVFRSLIHQVSKCCPVTGGNRGRVSRAKLGR